VDADRFLCEHGLILRPVGNYGLPDCLRLTVGSEEANRKGRRGPCRFHETAMSDSAKPIFEKVALLGIGLIGSSMAHAMRRAGLASHIAGYTQRAQTLERARAVGFADSLHGDAASCVKDADPWC